jgi:hypothetical protein
MLTLRSAAAPVRGHRRVTSTRLVLAGITVAALCAPVQAQADSTTNHIATQLPSPAGAPLGDEARAVVEAERTGKSVMIPSARSETGEITANPDGTLTLTEYALPVRVHRGKEWVPVDTTLTRRGDGRLAARAAVTDVTFSAGGTDPLVRLTTEGRSLDIDWPGALPAPVIDGSQITYPEVMPGVDLSLRADADGFSQALVVKTAEAAQNPELRAVEFALNTTSLNLEANASGVIEAKNPAGQVVLASSTPRMWDSAGAPTQAEPTADRSAKAMKSSAAPEKNASDTAQLPSDVNPGANSADVGVLIDEKQNLLTLKPDHDLLTSTEAVYPIYIDPRITGTRSAWTIAYKAHPTSSFWNGKGWDKSGTDYARVGYEKEDGGTGRSFFRLDTRKLAGVQVLDAQFNITETHSWSCNPRPVELWLTGAISAKTTWKKQPKWSKKLSTKNVAHGNETYGCADAGVDFDATYAATQAAAKKWKSTTFGLKATKENDTYAWKKFKTNAKLIVDINRIPSVPTGLDTVPSTNNGKNCGATAPYVTLGMTDVQFSARVKDADDGTVRARFKIWPSGTGNEAIVDEYVSVTTGSIAKLPVEREVLKKAAPKGGQFSWTVLANDKKSSSAWARPSDAYCHFAFDPVRPGNRPVVSSTQFPEDKDVSDATPARTLGAFTITSGGVKDVVEYRYSLDRSPPTEPKKPLKAGDPVEVKLTPASTGPHKLYAYSLDAAGNKSDTEVYLFYAGSTGVTDKPGDLNGDGNPDLYSINSKDQLRMHPGAGSTAAPGPAIGVTSDVDWGNALVTHRGDWTDDGYEDVVTRRSDGKLWLYPTDGFGEFVDSERQEFLQFDASEPEQVDPEPEEPEDPPIEETTDPAVRAEADEADAPEPTLDLAAIDQLASLGDISNDAEAVAPDFVAVVDDQLWYLEGYPGAAVGDAYPIGDSGWAGTTVLAAGDHDKDGFVDLFVRERSSGKLWLQRGRPDALDPASIDPTSLGSPANRLLLDSTGWSATTRPMLTSAGDADGDGINDLWSSDSTGKLLHNRSRAGQSGLAPVVLETSGWQGLKALS